MSAGRRNFWISVLLLGLAIPLPGLAVRQHEVPLRRPLADFAYRLDGWRGSDAPLDDRVAAVLGTKDFILREYVDAEAVPVWLYVSYFGRQKQGAASHSPRHCLPGAGWQPLDEQRVPYPLAAGPTPTINEIVFGKNDQRQLVYYWFRERDRIVASEYMVKFYLMWDALLRRRTDGALVRVSTPVDGSTPAARERAVRFMQQALPQLDAILPD